MTWLSRLQPTGRGLRWRAGHDNRRRGHGKKSRRRTIALEPLEGRIVLSNVTATQIAGNVLMITGDATNDSFSVTASA